ncbi:MAG: hypothetical protein WKG07_24800 [Hymenobacter sp.]
MYKVSILYLEGEYSLTEKLLRRCLGLAEQGEFTAHAEDAASQLLRLYTEQRQRIKYQQLEKKVKELRTALSKEQEAQQILNNVTLTMTKTVAAPADHATPDDGLHRAGGAAA